GQILDPRPLPVCGDTRSGRARCLPTVADSGHGAAQKLDYSGFKLGLRSARWGRSISFPLWPARPHGLRFLADLVEGCAGLGPADTGFLAAFRQGLLAERHGVLL